MRVFRAVVTIAGMLVLAACGMSRSELQQELERQAPQFQVIVQALDQYHGLY